MAPAPSTPGWAQFPAWSLDGTRIAFVVPASFGKGKLTSPAKIDVISPNGAGRATVFKAPSLNEYLYFPTWSPDSAHVALRVFSMATYPWTDDVYRGSAAGGKAVNLTADIGIRAFLMSWR